MTAPAATSPAPTPRITRFRPIYRCLGYVENAQGYRRYVIAFGDPERVVIRRVGEMTGLEFLLKIYADLGHWRHLFPRPAGRRRLCRQRDEDLDQPGASSDAQYFHPCGQGQSFLFAYTPLLV